MSRTMIFSLLLATGCGGPLISAELDAPEICQELEAFSVPAAPPGLPANLSFTQVVALPDELQQLGASAEVELLSVWASAEGVPDLGFLQSVRLTARQEQGDSLLAEYTSTGELGGRINLRVEDGFNFGAHLTEHGGTIDTSVTGVLPTKDWTLKTRVCSRINAHAALR